MNNKSVQSFEDKLKKLNNPNLEKLLLKSIDDYGMTGGKNKEDIEDENDERYLRKIYFENNTDISIEKFRSLKEFKLRDKFNKWEIFGGEEEDEKSKKQSNSFWFFNIEF